MAVELLLSHMARKSHNRERLRREVQALAKLHHPAIAAIVHFGEVDEEPADRKPERSVERAPWFATGASTGGP